MAVISQVFRRVTLSLMVALLGLMALPKAANAASEPLITIRFNQQRVYFDQQLYGVIAKAVEIKPDLMFDVISLAPVTGNENTDKQWQALAGRNTRSVVTVMTQMGVPMERINVRGQSTPGIRYDETQVFVR